VVGEMIDGFRAVREQRASGYLSDDAATTTRSGARPLPHALP
jgi:hypothetical protein